LIVKYHPVPVTILCYHAVDPAWRSVLSVSPEEFERHCAWLRRNRTVAPLEEIVGRMDSGGRPRRGTTALTFDDGFASVFHHAFPTLRRHGLPATMFVVAETLTPMGRAVDWVDDPPSQTLATLTREQVLEMRDAGIRFGSHSYRHADLPSLTEEECIHDLRASRELLEDLLSRPVPFLAYPRGLHDERVRRAAQRASFTHAFSLPEAREPSGPFAVPRVGVYPGNGVRGLRIKTSPWYLSLRTSRVYPAIRAVATRR
jgi:peptidoglycan/xylan/chitin deacetylase (PgdA/CDA1 family)